MINPKLRWFYKPFPKEYSLKKTNEKLNAILKSN